MELRYSALPEAGGVDRDGDGVLVGPNPEERKQLGLGAILLITEN